MNTEDFHLVLLYLQTADENMAVLKVNRSFFRNEGIIVFVVQYYVCIAVFTLDAGLQARSQYSDGPATGHLDTGFTWFPCA